MKQYDFNNIQDGIAIIGLGGRFPGAENPKQLWKNLIEKVESIQTIQEQELVKTTSPSVFNHPNYVRRYGALDTIKDFDASFFDFTPYDAGVTDPQHRLFLEVAYETLEDAGYCFEEHHGRVGVFVGGGQNNYVNRISSHLSKDPIVALQASIGNFPDMLATQVSYKLNLTGPSLSIQTACSSSLVALHYACQSLILHECEMALAGGVSIRALNPTGYFYQKGGILSSDGHCRPFDQNATGTVPGDGAGAVALKRLEDAIAEKDQIYAIIRGTAVNNDGSKKVGYTAPGYEGQVAVISDALLIANTEAEAITYVETHGTGTQLGDPIEVAALSEAFRKQTAAKRYCAIGSVKSNIGHLDAAAGIVGLIKTTLSLKNEMILPTLHFDTPNSEIDFETSPFYVNSEVKEWTTSDTPRLAGVSSFGIGGTNAHVILQEAPSLVEPSVPVSLSSQKPEIFLLSAKTWPALEKMRKQLAVYLTKTRKVHISNLSYTLKVGRKKYDKRYAFVASSIKEVITNLSDQEKSSHLTQKKTEEKPFLVFQFPGQGSQYLHMGRKLYQSQEVFRQKLDDCAEIVKDELGDDLRKIIYPDDKQEMALHHLNQTRITQPALFIIEYALASQLNHWGIIPDAMVGHSIGEYVAACLAGVISLKDALHLIVKRGSLIQSLSPGAMLSVPMEENKIIPYLDETLSIAAVYSHSHCVVSGSIEAIQQFEEKMKTHGIIPRLLTTSHAFHSWMMDPIIGAYTEYVQSIPLQTPTIPYLSNKTGTWITNEECQAAKYYADHLRSPIQYSKCLQTVFQYPNCLLLEVGPGKFLSSIAKQIALKENFHPRDVISTLRHQNEQKNDEEFLLYTVGNLWKNGVNIDWAKQHASSEKQKISLPTYPFERSQYWLEAKSDQQLLYQENYSTIESPKKLMIDEPQTSDFVEISSQIQQDSRADLQHEQDQADLINEIEKAVTEIWEELFGIQQIGINEDFFELSGNSLIAIQLISQLNKMFKVEVPISVIFENPTISGVAQHIIETQLNTIQDEELELLLDEVELLSDDEIQTLLENNE